MASNEASEPGTVDCIAILDAGSQFAKVIDRRVRELSVQSEILPLHTPVAELAKYKGIIISGGPQSVYGSLAPKYDPDFFTRIGVPVLGICYGLQLMAHVHSGSIEKKEEREDGVYPIEVLTDSLLFAGLPKKFNVLLTHGDSLITLPPDFETVAVSTTTNIPAAIQNVKKQLYAVQYHPEVDLSDYGNEVFSNFLFKIAKCNPEFTLISREKQAIAEIRAVVGSAKVLVLVSGGVDSSVCAALLKAALPAEQIYALHIDHGFMRLNESAQVTQALAAIGLNLQAIDASTTFANATTVIDGERTESLHVTVRPEVKRKIIGDTFMTVSETAVRALGLDPAEVFLAQGTLRPDLIESASELASASGNATVIKTHHNDTQLVRDLRARGRIVEPLRDYHKDEVRALGVELGLPPHLVWRQPFPGPGLAIRILCATEPFLPSENEQRTILAQLSAYTTTPSASVSPSAGGSPLPQPTAGTITEGGAMTLPVRVHATLLPCRTVGVQGDCRSYSSLVALSVSHSLPDHLETAGGLASESDLAPIATAPMPWDRLFELAQLIPQRVHGVNRVVVAFGPPLPQGEITTITPTLLTPDTIAQLQLADDIVNKVLLEFDLVRLLSQVPVILFPADFGKSGCRGICIRTFITNDFMTGVPARPGQKHMPFAALDKIVNELLANVPGIGRVCYDLTGKPPGTTEWE